LERAVRSMEWLPGEVYVWAAGEAVSLKGIRRHLSAERGVPRERTHITGYWRRTEPDPVAGVEQAEDDAHERLHELTDLAPGFAIRAAVT
ncbi:siderophore-interacting protein, partial [Streptomyces sp. SID7982]|nr:siderophore-interacting protein [Streptomyces sp. SID7982]